ncbi:MAG: DUF1295 domain-containing protein [Gemmatimonadota bacterium]
MTAFWSGLALLLVAWTGLWLVSVRLRDVSIVDIAWGPAFLIMALVGRWHAADPGLRSDLTLAAVAIWSLRLAVHLALRARGRGEDRRYAAMRSEHGEAFVTRSLVTVFWLQAVLAGVLSVPLLAAVDSAGAPGVAGWLGLGLVASGVLLESVADAQLVRFKRRRDSDAGVLDSGLWRYSRHPNYFGEAVLWWGFGLLAVDAGAIWTIFSPVVMTGLLLKVSGVPLLEEDMRERRPEYADYVRRTPSFIPWFPRDE